MIQSAPDFNSRESHPKNICVPIFVNSYHAPYWQQEKTYLILSLIAASRINIFTSNMNRKQLKTFKMHHCADDEFSLNSLPVAEWQILMFPHVQLNFIQSAPNLICVKSVLI